MSSRRSRFVQLIAISVPGLVSLPVMAGFLGDVHPAFDSFAHFRAHLAVLLAVSALAPLAVGFWKEAAAAVVLGLAALSTTAVDLPVPGIGAAAADARPSDRAVYRLLQLNLLHNNREPEKALSAIGRIQPDIITLNEVSAMWAARLEPLAAIYPYRLLCSSPKRIGGVAILSRRPFDATAKPYCLSGGQYGVARIDLGGNVIDVAALHLDWPWPFGQARQIDHLATELSGLSGNALLAGDFNAVGWSAAVKRVMEAGGFLRVPPTGPTWLHHSLPAALRDYVGLPIDHVLTKGMVRVHAAQTAGDAGSDHAPVLVEFSVEAKPAPEEPSTALVMLK
jgi:endonuclease/exonuclease/phosphatase (EEP) superfamily protein YafD